MNDDERRQRLEDLAYEGEGAEVTDEDVERVREEAIASLIAAGYTADEVSEMLRAFPPEKGKEKPKPGAKAEADPKKPCDCDKVEGKHTVGDHKKTSSSGEKPSEKKSEDDTSVAPEEGAGDAEPRNEDPNDAAQAGTSTGMTKNARERALSLLNLI